MSHIHTQPGQHDTTVSAYIVRLDTSEPSLILHLHKKLKILLQFGGHVELDENPWQALTHEVTEESGYHMSQLQLLQPSMRMASINDAALHPYPVNIITHKFAGLEHYHTDISYAFITDQPPLDSIGIGESADIRLFTAKELAAIPPQDTVENVRETGLFVLQECLKQWEPVSTAGYTA